MGLKTIIISMGLVILFAIAIISYMIGFASDNNAPVSISDDPSITTYQNSLSDTQSNIITTANESSNVLQEVEIKSGDENVEGGGQFKATPGSLTSSFRTIISTGQKIIFGNDTNFAYFATALFSLLIIILGLYIWKAWKGGLPD